VACPRVVTADWRQCRLVSSKHSETLHRVWVDLRAGGAIRADAVLASHSAKLALGGAVGHADCSEGSRPKTVPPAARACIVQVRRNSGGGAKVVMQKG
jgi:hypothetical protein